MKMRLAARLGVGWVVVVAGSIAAVGAGCSSSSSSSSGAKPDGGTMSDAGSPDSELPADSSTGGPDVSAEGGTAAEVCANEAHAICQLRSTCSMGFDITRNYPDLATCESRTAATCVYGLAAAGTAQTPAHVQACTAAYPSESCTDFFDDDPVAACVPPAGSLMTGAACGASGQCASTYCAIADDQVCGTCQPLPAAGAPCQVQADCGRDLACAIPTGADGGAGSCAPFGAAGATCLTGVAPCAAGLSCVGDDVATSTMGTCKASGASVGTACDATRKTAAACDSDIGLVCIPTAQGSGVGTCQKIQLAGAGEPCGDIGAAPITGFAVCQDGGQCVKTSPTATMGVCAGAAADGSACDNDPSKGPPCLPPAKCVPTGTGTTAGTCTPPNATKCM